MASPVEMNQEIVQDKETGYLALETQQIALEVTRCPPA
jgi:hypothetical protein